MKQRMIMMFAGWLIATAISAINTITISSTEGAPGDEVTISIALENTDAVSSLQVGIPLDENLTLVENSGQVGSRCDGHSLTVGVKDGVLNVFVYSTSMAALTGNSGEVASFRLKLGNQPKTVTLTPSKTVLTSTDGQTVTCSATHGEVTTRCAKAQYSAKEVDFGEVPIRSTYQRTVTVENIGNSDLTITGLTFSDVNIFSSTTALPMVVAAGGSQTLNITYAPEERGSITKTLKVECNSISKLNTIKLLAQPFAVNELHIQPASGISDEEVTVRMTMNNMDAISGYQVEFDLPEQFEYVDGSFTLSGRKQDHSGMATLNGKKLRIIAYSSSDQALTGDDGEIGSFRVKLVGRYGTTLTPTKTVLSANINNKVENVVSAVYGGEISISSPQISCEGSLDFGEVSVTEACERAFTIYNYGNAPLTISRVVFDNENMSVKESMPLVIPAWESRTLTVVYGSVEQKSFEATMNIYSNDPEQRLLNVAVAGSRFAPNYLEVETKDVFVNGMLTIEVSLNTYDPITGLQFDVTYPHTIFEPFDGNVLLEERAQGMTVTAREIATGTLRYFCYFLNGNSIAAGSGKAFSIQMRPIGGEAPEGNYTLRVTNTKLGTSEMADKYAGTDTETTFRVKGHAAVTVTAKSYTREYGEANPTFEYTVEGETLNGIPEISCEVAANTPVGVYPIVIKKGTVTNEEDCYVNGTLTITKAPLTISAGSYSKKQGEAMPDFVASFDGFKNGETKDVLTKQPVFSCEATASSAPGEYVVTVSGAEAENYAISYVSGVLTVEESSGIQEIMASGKPFDVYNTMGVKIRHHVTSFDGLPAGIYIVNGQKVMVKKD